MKKIIFLCLSLFLTTGRAEEDSRVRHLTTVKDSFGNKQGYKGDFHHIVGEVFDDISFVPSPISHAKLVVKQGAVEVIRFNSNSLGEFDHQLNLPDGEYSIELISDGWGGQEFFQVKSQVSKKIKLRAVKTSKSKKNNSQGSSKRKNS